MSSSGNPNEPDANLPETRSVEDTETEGEASSSPSLRQRIGLLLAALLLVGVFLVGVQLVDIIAGLIFIPDPPVPSNVSLVEHENFAYGVDEWLYSASFNACDVVTYYLERGGECRVTPGQCGTSGTIPQGQSTQNVATCTGSVDFSIFNMGWEANIATGYRFGDPTRFRLRREVFWVGSSSAAPE